METKPESIYHCLYRGEEDEKKRMYLGHEDEAKRDRSAENDENRNDEKSSVLLVNENEGDGDAEDAHDDHVVHAHPDVLAVVQRGQAHVPRLPREKTAEYLRMRKKYSRCDTMVVFL
jgi:hypothetical protein